MRIKNRQIDPEFILNFSTYNDPFKSNSYVLVLDYDNGQNESFTYFKIDEMQEVVNQLINEIKLVRGYKHIINGIPRINIKERSRIRSKS